MPQPTSHRVPPLELTEMAQGTLMVQAQVREAAVEEGREEREEEEKELDLVGEGMEVDLMDKMEVAVALKVNMEEENIFLLTSHVQD